MWVQPPHQVFTALTSHLIPNPCTLSFLTLAFSSHSLPLHPPYPCPPSVSFAYPAHFNHSSILSMSIVRLIGLSCPLRPFIHLVHVLRPSYPLILPHCIPSSTLSIYNVRLILISCPTAFFHPHLSMYTVCPICLSCPTASLHPLYPCTLSVLRLSCPSAFLYPPYPCTLSVLLAYPAPLHPFILLIHVIVHCPSHPFYPAPLHPFIHLIHVYCPSYSLILPHCVPSSTLSMYTVRLICLSCPLHSFPHLIHVHYPSYSLISPHCIPSSSLSIHCPSHPFYPAPLRPFIHFIHVHYPSHLLILPYCISASSLSMYSLFFLRCS
jgi:hypothetical protein